MISVPTSEADILDRLILPSQGDLAPEAARSLLTIQFGPDDRQRMQELARRAKEGDLSPEELSQAEAYERVGNLLGLLQSKARLSLKQLAGER